MTRCLKSLCIIFISIIVSIQGYKKTQKPIKVTPTFTFKDIKKTKKVWFKFKEEPIVDVINYLAAQKKCNVVLPQGPHAINAKISFEWHERLSIEQAWQQLITILNTAGYNIIEQNNLILITMKNKELLSRNPIHLYINTPVKELPDTDQTIRYLRYLVNIRLNSNQNNSLQKILNELLSPTASFISDSALNVIIITDQARNIKSILHIIEELDSFGTKESLEIISLKHASASLVNQLFSRIIQNNAPSSYPGFNAQPQKPESTSQYFSKNIKIVAESRTNKLIIMGKEDAVKRVQSFIRTYIDVPLDTGKSVLHVYDLQYLNAQDFVSTLQSIVNSGVQRNTNNFFTVEQSTSSVKNTGSEQYFKDVIVIAEKQTAASSNGNSSNNNYSVDRTVQGKTQGGNRLIIAARYNDWTRIKNLIKKLDTPQKQIAIEVLVVDITFTLDRLLGTQIRNKKNFGLKNANFQTDFLGNLEVEGGTNPTSADALAYNLLALDNAGLSGTLASRSSGGSLILSFKDKAANNIWGVLQLLNNYSDTKVLSQPFIVTTNNVSATFVDAETRYGTGGSTQSNANNIVIEQIPLTASTNITILPTINGNNNINLGISISIAEFQAEGSNAKTTRNIITNSNIKDGEVLILGGLTGTKYDEEEYETPFLGKIPLIKWLFKRKKKNFLKANLMVFICPHIIKTTKGTTDPFTIRKLNKAEKDLEKGQNFEGLQDPITRWFFGSHEDVSKKNVQYFRENNLYLPSKKSMKDQKELVHNKPVAFQTTSSPRQKSKIFAHLPMPGLQKPVQKKELSEQKIQKELRSLFSQKESDFILKTI